MKKKTVLTFLAKVGHMLVFITLYMKQFSQGMEQERGSLIREN